MTYRKTFSRIILIAWSTIVVIFLMCSIILNNAQAKSLFKPRIEYDAGHNPISVAIGDLNGDGHLDLTVANVGSNMGSGCVTTTDPGQAICSQTFINWRLNFEHITNFEEVRIFSTYLKTVILR